MSRYLSWSGLTTKVFNVGEYRREATQDYRLLLNRICVKGKLRHLLRTILTKNSARKHEFFNPNNSEAMALRLAIANSVLDESIQWLEGGGEVRNSENYLDVNKMRDKGPKFLWALSIGLSP